MLEQAICFSYDGAEREGLRKIGHWLYQHVANMNPSQQLLLARTHGRGSCAKILELISRLTDRGDRVVIFENEAFRIAGIIDSVLNIMDIPADSEIARMALPYFRDVGEVCARAKMEYRNSKGLKPHVRRVA